MKKILVLISILAVIISSCSHEKTIHPVYKNIVETVYASGFVLPENEYKVFALSNGTIIDKKIKDGDSVRAGDVLFVVNNEAQSALLSSAQTAYNNASLNISDASPLLNDLRLSVQNANTKYINDSINYIRYSNLLKEDAGDRSKNNCP